MLGKFHPKEILKWALSIAIIILKTPFVSFDISVPELARLVADKVKDGKLTDDELADLLEYIKDKIR